VSRRIDVLEGLNFSVDELSNCLIIGKEHFLVFEKKTVNVVKVFTTPRI